jgi:hypothetical protein
MASRVRILTPENASGLYAQPPVGIDALVAKLDMRADRPAVIVSCGDSTINAPEEAYALAFREIMAELYPERPVDYIPLNATQTAPGTPIVWQAGTSIDATTAVVFRDTFTRTGPLAGSAPEVGRASGTWSGSAALMSTDGQRAVSVPGSSGWFYDGVAFALAKAVTDFTTASFTITCSTSNGATKVETHVRPAYFDNANYIGLYQTSTNGSSSLEVRVKASNVTRSLSFPAGTIPAGQATATVAVTAFALAGSTLTVTVNGATVTTELTSGELSALSIWDRVSLVTSDPTFSIDNLAVTSKVPATGSTLVPKVKVYNAAVPGSKPDYHLSRLSTIYPEKPDLLVFCHGHNTRVPVDEFVSLTVPEFLDAFLTLWPGTPIAVMTQNPRFAPADHIQAIADRMLALRLLARRRGWTVFDTYSAMAKAPDGGKSLISFDATADPPAGIHPTHPADGSAGGSRVQANEIKRAWKALSTRTT